MRGRPAKYSNAAEKQKAYRERVKADDQRLAQALALLDDAREYETALRKTCEYHQFRGSRVQIEYHRGILFDRAGLYVDGHFREQIDPILFRYLLRSGALVKVDCRSPFSFDRYEIKDRGGNDDNP